MRDHLSEELISAYIDGELADEQRELVQRMLAESEEYRQFYEEIQGLRSSLQRLPKYQLSDGFQERVLAQIRRLQVDVREPETAPIASVRRRRSSRLWPAALGIAVVAAAVVCAILLGPAPDDPEFVQGKQGSGTSRPDLFTPDGAWYDEQFVYYVRPSRGAPTHTTVVDLVITPAGQANTVFQDTFRAEGVPFDPEMVIDQELEERLLSSKITGNVQPAGQGDEGDRRDEVELFYVVCDSDKANRILLDLEHHRKLGEVARIQLGLIFNTGELEMMYQLNRASVARFAGPDVGNEKRSLFHRLVFSVKLRSVKLATIPIPSLDVRVAAPPPDEQTPATSHLQQLERAPTELLFVVRNLMEPAE